MNEGSQGHPLNNEDVLVTVALKHVPTGVTVQQSIHAPVDADPTVHEALEQAFDVASDVLLDELEQKGGG